jgi:thiamine biosynthesis lipoprotein
VRLKSAAAPAQDGKNFSLSSAWPAVSERLSTGRRRRGNLHLVLDVTKFLRRYRFLLVSALLAGAGCVTPRQDSGPLSRFEFTQPQMGLPFRIVLYAPDHASADSAARAAFARVSQLNDILSDYDTDSELSRLSRTAGESRAVPVSADLWFALERSRALAARTDGAFDPTVGPLVSLWRKARREKSLPRADLLAEALAAVGWEKLRLNGAARTATLLAPNMRLDLASVAKGYAVDEALKVLRQHGMTRALVAGAGDMAASDPPPAKKGWRIEVAPLDATNAPAARFVLLRRAALGTSGDLFQHVEIDGVRYSHIVNPKTGLGLTDHSLVTVIASDCATANSLATAVSVLGPQTGLKLIEETPAAAARIVRKPGAHIEAFESRRFRHHLDPNQNAD